MTDPIPYTLSAERLADLSHSDESQLFSGDLVAELASELITARNSIEKVESLHSRLLDVIRITIQSLANARRKALYLDELRHDVSRIEETLRTLDGIEGGAA